MARTIDLNSDLGESFGPWRMGSDEAMLSIVSSANIACGFHAGDPMTMRRTLELARKNGVGAGAHPGFNDKEGFGRRQILGLSQAEIENMIAYQVGALMGIAAHVGVPVTHVKAHGALGNMSTADAAVALAVVRGVKGVDRSLPVVVMPATVIETAAEKEGQPMMCEIFADRAYRDDGTLMPRGQPGALIEDEAVAVPRIIAMLEDGALHTVGGKRIEIPIDTICVHGDNAHAVEIARKLRSGIEAAGWRVESFAKRSAAARSAA
ncbi:MAG: LamB/YcsF family protein [Alphaproteobacteria bacterium]|nr:LamB/YcsF family protein [Alphaproteobacteria bacterium]